MAKLTHLFYVLGYFCRNGLLQHFPFFVFQTAQSYKVYVDGQHNLPAPDVVTSSASVNLNASLHPVHIVNVKVKENVEEKLRYVETTQCSRHLLHLCCKTGNAHNSSKDYLFSIIRG